MSKCFMKMKSTDDVESEMDHSARVDGECF